MDLAGAAADQDRSKDALLVYREALALREKLFGSQHQSNAETYAAIARVCQMMNDQAQARRTHAVRPRNSTASGSRTVRRFCGSFGRFRTALQRQPTPLLS
jgi:hypothetical protein